MEVRVARPLVDDFRIFLLSLEALGTPAELKAGLDAQVPECFIRRFAWPVKGRCAEECPSNIEHSQAELYCQYCCNSGRGNAGSVTQRKNRDEQWRREE